MDSESHPALLLVDGVSSIGALNFEFDNWKVDVAVTGSQKALSLPTGLAVVAISDKVGPSKTPLALEQDGPSPYLISKSDLTEQKFEYSPFVKTMRRSIWRCISCRSLLGRNKKGAFTGLSLNRNPFSSDQSRVPAHCAV